MEKMRQEMGVIAINDAIKLGRLRWFGHVKTREEGNWVKRCMDIEIEDSGLHQSKVSPLVNKPWVSSNL